MSVVRDVADRAGTWRQAKPDDVPPERGMLLEGPAETPNGSYGPRFPADPCGSAGRVLLPEDLPPYGGFVTFPAVGCEGSEG